MTDAFIIQTIAQTAHKIIVLQSIQLRNRFVTPPTMKNIRITVLVSLFPYLHITKYRTRLNVINAPPLPLLYNLPQMI